MSRVPSGKGDAFYPFCSDAEDMGVMKSASQFPGMVHEALHKERQLLPRQRKGDSHKERENSPHKTSGAVHDTSKTYVTAANNRLPYQCFTLRGSKRGSKGFTF